MDAFKKRESSTDSSSEYSNIFKSFGKRRRDYISNLNKLYKDIYYEKVGDKICKNFLNRDKFDWELYVLLTLHQLDLEITPAIKNIEEHTSISVIEYDSNNIKSLREVFENSGYNFHYIINELLAFIRNIRNKKVIIGNLHLDSIYVNTDTMKFYILDLSNTAFSNLDDVDISLQSLYISFHDANVKNKIIKYFEKEMDVYNKEALSKCKYTDNIIDLYKLSN